MLGLVKLPLHLSPAVESSHLSAGPQCSGTGAGIKVQTRVRFDKEQNWLPALLKEKHQNIPVIYHACQINWKWSVNREMSFAVCLFFLHFCLVGSKSTEDVRGACSAHSHHLPASTAVSACPACVPQTLATTYPDYPPVLDMLCVADIYLLSLFPLLLWLHYVPATLTWENIFNQYWSATPQSCVITVCGSRSPAEFWRANENIIAVMSKYIE